MSAARFLNDIISFEKIRFTPCSVGHFVMALLPKWTN